MAALRREAERRGVAFVRAEVTGWRAARGRIDAVCTAEGDQAADQYVVSAGTWSTSLARGLGLRLPMQAGKGLSLTLPRPRRLPVHCAILSEARVAVTPMGDALRFAGTMELCGIDRTVSPARVRGLVRSVPRYLPDFTDADFAGVSAWSGLRPCSPDGLPYLGRSSRYSNLLIGTGHAMVGVSLGPITGRLLAEILSGEPPSIDVQALSPDRHG
jgi:D-amino-acid dehydrogenase